MSSSSLLSALIIGLVVGVGGWIVMPGRKAAPVWLTLALGVAAALLGSITVRLLGAGEAELRVIRLFVQSGFAGVAVLLAIVTAGRRPGQSTHPDPPVSGPPIVTLPPASDREGEERR